MSIRSSQAIWEGDVQQGRGRMRLGENGWEGDYSFQSRFESGQGTNPEELLAAAHAGCFSMALSAALSKAGHPPTSLRTVAKVHLEKTADGFRIPRVELFTEGTVAGIDEGQFREKAEEAKQTCPVSQLFRGAEIRLAEVIFHAEPVTAGAAG